MSNTTVFTTLAGTNAEKTLAATAGNAAGTIFTVPAGQRYIVLYGRSKLIADATVVNRNIYIYIDDGSGNVRWQSQGSANITATQTKYASFGAGTTDSSTGVAIDVSHLTIPINCILEAGEKLVQAVQNGVAGDSHTARFYVLALGVKT